MHAVIVDGDVSYPPTSGKRLRTLNLMLRLAESHRLTYIARGDAGLQSTREAHTYLSDHGIETMIVDHPVPQKKGLAFGGRLAGNLLWSDLPYSVASHRSLPMHQAVQDYAGKHAVDVWQFEWLPYMETLPQPAAGRVVVAHNVDTLLWRRYFETARGPLRRCFLRQQWLRMQRYERLHFPQASWVVAVSPDDAQIIRDDFAMPRVDVVDNGIDRAYFESVSSRRDAHRILFLGALDWRPNLDALKVLLEQIFPRVRTQEPSAALVVVGRNPPASLVQRVKACQGAELHADVPDVRPFLGQCGVMTVPLRIGGGSRLKILEALACGLPVVSTTVGAEGLSLIPGHHFVCADEPDAMAGALVEAIRLPEPIRAMASQGRQLVLERYDWNVLAGKLEQVWLEAKASPCISCS